MPEDARYPGFARLGLGGLADLPDHQRVGGGPVGVQYRQRPVVPHNLQRQHVTVERQRAVKITNLEIDTEEPGRLWRVVCHHLLLPGQAAAQSTTGGRKSPRPVERLPLWRRFAGSARSRPTALRRRVGVSAAPWHRAITLSRTLMSWLERRAGV